MYLKNKKLENIPYNVIAENIDVAIDFLLVFLDADVLNHVNNGNWLNEVMEKEIKQINADVTVMWFADVALKPYYVEDPSKHLPSQHSNPVSDDDEIVGFDIATEKGRYEQGIFSTFLSGNKIPSWFTKLVVRSILKENYFENYYVQTASPEGRVEEEEDDDDSILDYDNNDEDEEATLVEIEELFGDLGERNGTILQQCVNIDELKQFVIFEGEKKLM
ncbi:hypothetical protein CQW23_33082 [Capsicum baccatum]|uniref:Uncharacterized protein n=1 Tax=Capsicum baccatum TaxID=33114 RepID=A0A2G2V2U9_CAPBA|nr:hypothetical protein CQW23_33082 [Capsicum baccatum]